ncbi:hypothetical protein [Rubrivirga sp. IMCC45206]|uniref:hypothetical protein n=1 Tax=Rubrivirga sp. IMCC45206 TaxID=3391614 RepID=UPI00398FF404
MPRPALRALLVLTLLGVALAACAGVDADPYPEVAPTVRGVVASVRHSATASGLLVEPVGDACGLQAVADDYTRVSRRLRSGRLAPARIGEVREGDTVEVFVDGPVAAMCPREGHAAAIVIVPSRRRT